MKNIKTFLSFIVPIFITTMYIKFFYEIYYKMNLSIDSTTSVIILNFIIFIIFLLISIEDIINLFKNKSFIGGLIEKKPIKRKSLAYQKAEALFTKFDTGVVSVNGKSVAYI